MRRQSTGRAFVFMLDCVHLAHGTCGTQRLEKEGCLCHCGSRAGLFYTTIERNTKLCKSARAVGGEPEDGPWSPDLFDPGGELNSIAEELAPPGPMHISWSCVAMSGWNQGSPFQ